MVESERNRTRVQSLVDDDDDVSVNLSYDYFPAPHTHTHLYIRLRIHRFDYFHAQSVSLILCPFDSVFIYHPFLCILFILSPIFYCFHSFYVNIHSTNLFLSFDCLITYCVSLYLPQSVVVFSISAQCLLVLHQVCFEKIKKIFSLF